MTNDINVVSIENPSKVMRTKIVGENCFRLIHIGYRTIDNYNHIVEMEWHGKANGSLFMDMSDRKFQRSLFGVLDRLCTELNGCCGLKQIGTFRWGFSRKSYAREFYDRVNEASIVHKLAYSDED